MKDPTQEAASASYVTSQGCGGPSTGAVDKRDTCGKCGIIVKSKDKAVQCEMCEIWFHTNCTDIRSVALWRSMKQVSATQQL